MAVFTALLAVIAGYLSSRIGEGLIFDLRTQVFGRVQRQSLAFFTRTQTGALVSRLNNDVIGAQRAFTSALSSTVSNAIAVVVVGITMFALSWQVTLLCLGLFPILLVTSRFVSNRLAGLTRQQMDGNADMGNAMTERFNVGGAMLLKLFGRRHEEDALFADKAAVVRDLGVRISLVTRIFAAAMMLVPALATALVFGIGGHLAIDGTLTVGTVLALSTLLLRLIGPLQGLSNVRIDVMTALVSFERVFEVLDLPSLIEEKPGAVDIPPGATSLEFDRVAFAYPRADEISLASLETVARAESRDSGPVLADVSFRAAPGEMVALVGPSGAGKTTVTNLVARLYDVHSGSVRVGGLDVRDVTLESLEDAVGYVTQDAHMFHDTIRANLLYARPGADDAAVWAALEAAQIAPLIRGLPDGLETVVGDRGYRLSGGERQRLAIARLLLKAPGIVVLDEATAHLDSESEAAVQRALDAALRGPHLARDRAPALDGAQRRPHPRARRRPDRAAGCPRRPDGVRGALRRPVPHAVPARRGLSGVGSRPWIWDSATASTWSPAALEGSAGQPPRCSSTRAPASWCRAARRPRSSRPSSTSVRTPSAWSPTTQTRRRPDGCCMPPGSVGDAWTAP